MKNKIHKTVAQKENELSSFLGNRHDKVLFVTHNRGGGVEKHLRELTDLLPDTIEAIFLRPPSDGSKCVVLEYAGQLRLYFDYKSGLKDLKRFLSSINLLNIHFHHTKGLHQEVLDVLTGLGLPWDITIHDYYSICPQITLIDKQGFYCNEKGLESCQNCLKLRPAPGGVSIAAWREKYQPIVEGAKRCFVPSVDVLRRMQKYYPDANYLMVYHEPHVTGSESKIRAPDNNRQTLTDRLRVLVIGALTPMKGADLLERAAIDAKKRNQPVDFILIGEGYRKLVCKPFSHLEVRGKYQDDELQQLIKAAQADVVWFPALWPETYNFTLSAAIKAELPVVVPDIGAFQERLFYRDMAWVVPWNQTAEAFNRFFMSLSDRLQQVTNEAFDHPYRSKIPPAVQTFTYQNDYIVYDETRPVSNTQDNDAFFFTLKRRLEPPRSLFSVIKYTLFRLLNKLRSLLIFSWIVKLIPQSFQTRLKGWMLGESER